MHIVVDKNVLNQTTTTKSTITQYSGFKMLAIDLCQLKTINKLMECGM